MPTWLPLNNEVISDMIMGMSLDKVRKSMVFSLWRSLLKPISLLNPTSMSTTSKDLSFGFSSASPSCSRNFFACWCLGRERLGGQLACGSPQEVDRGLAGD